MQGDLTVVSRVGKGSKFTVSLRRATTVSHSGPEAPESPR
jgi:signal transduction histidine kinase